MDIVSHHTTEVFSFLKVFLLHAYLTIAHYILSSRPHV